MFFVYKYYFEYYIVYKYFAPLGLIGIFGGIIISTNISPLWGFFDIIINYGALGFHNCGFYANVASHANPTNGANVAGTAYGAGPVKRSEPQSGDILVEKDEKNNKAPEERHIINL